VRISRDKLNKLAHTVADTLADTERQKIASQRRIIPEGSQEWDILYRKYYTDEVKKLGL
jgi:hypothetical protein